MKKFLLTLMLMLCLTAVAEEKEIKYDFGTETYGMTREASTYLTDGYAVKNGDATITLNKTSGNAFRLWTNGLRFYKNTGASMTIAVGEKTITKIVLTVDGATFALPNGDPGKYENNTWTGASKAVKFNYTNTSANKDLVTVTITYQDEEVFPTECPAPIFSVENNADVYIGLKISVNRNGAEGTILTVNGEKQDDLEYVVNGNVGDEINLIAESYVTGKEGKITNSATIIVNIVDKPATSTCTFNFEEAEFGNLGEEKHEQPTTSGIDIPGTYTLDFVTMTLAKGEGGTTAPRWWFNTNKYTECRLYANNTVNISVPEDVYIVKVSFVQNEKTSD